MGMFGNWTIDDQMLQQMMRMAQQQGSDGYRMPKSSMGSIMGPARPYIEGLDPLTSGGMGGMGGMDPKSRMMLMVGQKLFNQTQQEDPSLTPMRTSPVNVGGMTPMSGDVMQGMQMQRGNMPDFRLGAGMLSDPNRRKQRRAQFLYGI